MVKHLLLSCLLLAAAANSHAQNSYKFSQPIVSFFSSAPLEDIEAVNKNARAVVDFENRAFLIVIPIKSFQFSSGLMQDHFNENYRESHKYPDCTFRGSFSGTVDLSKDGSYPVQATGDLLLHGVVQKRTLPATITVKQGQAFLQSTFNIRLIDHKIKVPKMVFKKIAEVVQVNVQSQLVKA